MIADWSRDLLLGIGSLGIILLWAQYFIARRHLRNPRAPKTTARIGISVLKPLCGLDDQLETNLAILAHLNYSDYEILLGVKDEKDPAFPIACEAHRRWPDRVRVIVQRGAWGLNPKVNQLITLSQASRNDLIVINDSNVRVGAEYLNEIADYFSEPEVGLVTHPVIGIAESSWGAWFDNLHLLTSIAPGVISAMKFAGQPIVVGKSMALRKSDLAKVGGFFALKDVLAEDYLGGKLIHNRLGKRVVIAQQGVKNVTRYKTVGDFYQRYVRWSIMQRRAVGLPMYFGLLVMNPLAWVSAAVVIRPQPWCFAVWGAMLWAKVIVDASAVALLRGNIGPIWRIGAVPIKDFLMFLAWAEGLVSNQIRWRGNRLRVLPGTVLVRSESEELKVKGQTSIVAPGSG